VGTKLLSMREDMLRALPVPEWPSGEEQKIANLIASALARQASAKKTPKASGEAKPMTDWRHHDLRRTVAARMADLGIEPHEIEAVLNHVSGAKAGVAGVYNRSLYAAEKRAALETWANHIRAVLDGYTLSLGH